MIYYQIKDTEGTIYRICCKIITRKSLFIAKKPLYSQSANVGYLYRNDHLTLTILRIGPMDMFRDKVTHCYSLCQFIRALKLCK